MKKKFSKKESKYNIEFNFGILKPIKKPENFNFLKRVALDEKIVKEKKCL